MTLPFRLSCLNEEHHTNLVLYFADIPEQTAELMVSFRVLIPISEYKKLREEKVSCLKVQIASIQPCKEEHNGKGSRANTRKPNRRK